MESFLNLVVGKDSAAQTDGEDCKKYSPFTAREFDQSNFSSFSNLLKEIKQRNRCNKLLDLPNIELTFPSAFSKEAKNSNPTIALIDKSTTNNTSSLEHGITYSKPSSHAFMGWKHHEQLVAPVEPYSPKSMKPVEPIQPKPNKQDKKENDQNNEEKDDNEENEEEEDEDDDEGEDRDDKNTDKNREEQEKNNRNSPKPKPEDPKQKSQPKEWSNTAQRLLETATANVGQVLWREFSSVVQGGRLGCAASISKVLELAGFPGIKDASVTGLVNKLKSRGWYNVSRNEMRPGDIVYVPTPGHVGIVGLNGSSLDNQSSTGRFAHRSFSSVWSGRPYSILRAPDSR